jgi:hypothetical protein
VVSDGGGVANKGGAGCSSKCSNRVGRHSLGVAPADDQEAELPHIDQLGSSSHLGARDPAGDARSWHREPLAAGDHLGTTRYAPNRTNGTSVHQPLSHRTRTDQREHLVQRPGGQGVAGSNPAVPTQVRKVKPKVR